MILTASLRRLRCLLVWLTATALIGALAAALLHDVRRPLPSAFDQLLVRVAEWALLGCAAWLWAVTTVVVGEAARGFRAHGAREHGAAATRPADLPGVPSAVRRLVLLACGAALVSGLAGPAVADEVHLPTTLARHLAHRFDRLPVPGRLPGVPGHDQHDHEAGDRDHDAGDREPRGHGSRGDAAVVVHAGDSLWTIAAGDLGPRASDAAITAEWHRIYAANRHVLGDDPGLIEPGQKLTLPQEERHD